jgi:mRNA-degrading endonuclease toxin of MazEF toxin-antitoxin module/uncharacterized protein RhaS with RHS repeats
LKKSTDAKGSIITNSYDKAGRVTKRTYSNEPQDITTPNVEYFYDGKGLTTPQTPNYAKGKLTKVTSSISETRYNSFDNFGRLLQMEQRTPFDTETIANAVPRVSSYQYDFGGRLIEQTYPSGKVVRNFFENDGDLAKVVRNGKVYASDFSYTSAGAIDKIRLCNGNWESTNYNERFQPIQIGLGNAANNMTNLWKVNYEYGELSADGTTVGINLDWRSIIVVPLSTSNNQARRGLTAIFIPQGEGGLSQDSVALCHQVTTLDRSKLKQKLGEFSAGKMSEIENGLKAAMDFQ